MMQFHQQSQSSSLLAPNLSSQLPIVTNKSQRSCQSLNILLPTPTTTMSRGKVAHFSSSFFSRRSVVCRPVLFSVFAWSVVLLFILSSFGVADAAVLTGHPLGKRSYIDLGCKGVYDKSIFARLDRVCEDCYNLFREPQIHSLCRQECFSSKYFTSCIQALLLEDEMEKFQEMAEYLGRRK
ncbi:ion transport peptide [Chelonus insularis]|uniref:ion transport peptide n=1 Tax=Chelonus insularis TaxID=460826 RepID=UPI00158EA0C6|nr:ion transport peptide [Chelonus insularis]